MSKPTCYVHGFDPIKSESRCCFGLAWFRTKDEAARYGAAVKAAGHKVNGGMLDGLPCDRAPEFDCDLGGARAYASRH